MANAMHTRQFGLIGKQLTHSFSPKFFAEKFAWLKIDARYDAFPLREVGDLQQLLAARPDLEGINVTIPYKSEVLPLLDFIGAEAAAIGAVNCIKIFEGKLIGYNTDVYGFYESLQPMLREDVRQALVLGSGGAARAVCYVLDQLQIAYKVVSASGKGDLDYDQLTAEIMQTHLLIVNTTPLGMFPDVASKPNIPYNVLGAHHLLFDLVYNPEETAFLKQGIKAGAQVRNGADMLHLQAERSWEIWEDQPDFSGLIKLK